MIVALQTPEGAYLDHLPKLNAQAPPLWGITSVRLSLPYVMPQRARQAHDTGRQSYHLKQLKPSQTKPATSYFPRSLCRLTLQNVVPADIRFPKSKRRGGTLKNRIEGYRPVKLVSARAAAAETIELDNGKPYRRQPAQIIDSPVPLLAEYKAKEGLGYVVPPPALVSRLVDVTVYNRGVISLADGRIIVESLINTWGQLSFPPFLREVKGGQVFWDAEFALSQVKAEDDRRVGIPVMIKQMWDNNYGHWLIESVPRVMMAQEAFSGSTLHFVVGSEQGQIGRIFRESLDLCGVRPDCIVATMDKPVCYPELIYPTPITVQPWIKAPRVVATLEQMAHDQSFGVGPTKLFVSRNAIGRRMLLNEDAVVAQAKARGYVWVDPGELSLREQINLFRSATHVISNLGAACASIVFSPRGVRFLALTTEFMQDDFFWDLVSQKQGSYTSLHGRAAQPERGMQSDFTIAEDRFTVVIDSFDQF